MNGLDSRTSHILCKNPRKRRTGSVLVLSAFLLVPMCAFVAFAVDLGYLNAERTALQSTADACALAAIRELPSEAALQTVADEYCTYNHPSGCGNLQVTAQAGTWDKNSLTFSPTNVDANAVRITVQRNNTALFFAPVIGVSQVDISASAVAVQDLDCFRKKGIIATDMVIMGQDVLLDNYCVYGRNGVNMGQDAVVINGAKVGALDDSTIYYGQDPIGLPENIVESDKHPPLAGKIMQVIDDLVNGVNLPPQITSVQHFPFASHLPPNLVSGTAYIFDESISIDQNYNVTDVIIATRKNISWGQDGTIRNISSSSGDAYAIGIYAGESISLGQDGVADGVNIVGGKDVTIGQDALAFSGTIQSAQKVIVGQAPQLTGTWLDAMPQDGNLRSFLVQ